MLLDTLQKINNFLYNKFGLKNFVLNLQLYINKKRAEKDKPDKKQFTTYDNGQIFSQ